jgi:prevent-host-death family protein
MREVPIDEVKSDLVSYLEIAEKEYVIITRQGIPVGILIGLKESDDWWEELLLCSPLFRARIDRARQNLREGKGLTLEQIRAKYADS